MVHLLLVFIIAEPPFGAPGWRIRRLYLRVGNQKTHVHFRVAQIKSFPLLATKVTEA
jgi:hypothetical protein